MPRDKRHQIRRVVSAVCGTPWAIEETTFAAIVELLQLRADGQEFSAEEIRLRIGVAQDRRDRMRAGSSDDEDEGDVAYQVTDDGIAILPLQGVLGPRLNAFQQISGGTSTQQFAGWVKEALADPGVRAIVMDVDSPGGSAAGNEEVAQMIRGARGQKPIVASVTGMATSAAYYIASAADKIFASPSSELGSIGTFTIHSESSQANADRGVKYTVIRAGENKNLANNVEPLTAKARASVQERLDGFNDQFIAAVAANRGVTPQTVQADFGQGKVMLAGKAVAAGLADEVGTMADALNYLRTNFIRPGATAAAGLNPNFPPFLSETPMPQPVTPATQPVQTAAAAVAPPVAPPPVAAAAPQHYQGPSLAESQRIRAEERARIEDLRARAELLQIDTPLLQSAIDGGTSVADALVQWTARMGERETGVSSARNDGGGVSHASQDKLFAAATEALERRCGPLAPKYAGKPVSPFARDLEHKSLMQLAEIFANAGGARVHDPDEVARLALRGDGGDIVIRQDLGEGYARPADFPNLLSNVMGKMMDVALSWCPATYRDWAAQLPAVADFKPKTIIQTGEFGELPRLSDSGDFRESTIAEEASWIQADQYGDEWTLTPRMVQDDDLGALEEVARDKVIAHEMTLNRLCVNLLVGNNTAGDGNPLFSSTYHANDIASGSGGVPSTTQLSALRLLLRKQKGPSGRRYLNLTLKMLLIPEDQETTTQQLLASLKVIPVPITDATADIFRGQVDYRVEPMLGDNSSLIYYGFADKNIARAIVYTFQRGFEGLKTRNYYNPKNNARVFQFEGRFAAAIRNWRGVARNAGQ